jgi:ABC-type Fe3+ transport system permease subunit
MYALWLAPLVLGIVLGGALARSARAAYAVIAVGLVVGFALILFAYLSAPPDYAHSGYDSDGREFLGRWWQPAIVFFLAGLAFVVYLVGVGTGAFVRELLVELRHPATAPEQRAEEHH